MLFRTSKPAFRVASNQLNLPDSHPDAHHEVVSISQYCCGAPRNLSSSHSGAVTMALSLQQPTVFLASTSLAGSSTYQEANSVMESTSRSAEGTSTGDTAAGSESTSPVDAPLSEAVVSVSPTQPSMIQGSLLIKISKPTKVRAITLSFVGSSNTMWIPISMRNFMMDDSPSHLNADYHDVVYINGHQWEFLPAENVKRIQKTAAGLDSSVTIVGTDLFGADSARCNNGGIKSKTSENTLVIHSSACPIVQDSNGAYIPLFQPSKIVYRKNPGIRSPTNRDSFILQPGEYVYNFSLAIDSQTPESLKVASGAVEYYMVAKLVRPGPFGMNISGRRDIPLVRSPPNNCDGALNIPTVISKIWDSRLHYEIVIPQKYVPLGTRLPIRIKLTPLDKVCVHRVRVMLTETVDYICSNDVTRRTKDRSLRVVLFEKKGESIRVPGQGQIPPKEKLIGDILEDSQGPTVFVANIPLLSTADDFKPIPPEYYTSPALGNQILQCLNPDSRASSYIKVRHRLVFTLRISRKGEESAKRNHFDVRIDTPITLLAKACSTENVQLPTYDEMPALVPWISDEHSSEDNEELPPSFHESLQCDMDGLTTPPPQYPETESDFSV